MSPGLKGVTDVPKSSYRRTCDVQKKQGKEFTNIVGMIGRPHQSRVQCFQQFTLSALSSCVPDELVK